MLGKVLAGRGEGEGQCRAESLVMLLKMRATGGTLWYPIPVQVVGCPSNLGRGRATGSGERWSKAAWDLCPGPDVGVGFSKSR